MFGVDFVPGIGDFKSFAQAKTATDYLAAVIGVVPIVGDVAGKGIRVGAKDTTRFIDGIKVVDQKLVRFSKAQLILAQPWIG